ncbi:MAG: hypothetical protein ACE5PV_01320 [Candidatus Poribacteria bacterium]
MNGGPLPNALARFREIQDFIKGQKVSRVDRLKYLPNLGRKLLGPALVELVHECHAGGRDGRSVPGGYVRRTRRTVLNAVDVAEFHRQVKRHTA